MLLSLLGSFGESLARVTPGKQGAYCLRSCFVQPITRSQCWKAGWSLPGLLLCAAKIEDMRREIGVTNGTGGVDDFQLIELIDEGTYGKVFRGVWAVFEL